MVDDSTLQIGDIVKLKVKYNESGSYGIVVEINRCEISGKGGWVSFDYVIMNEKEQIVRITEACVEKILYSCKN
tara:strand:+ start:60 stop:281 length:222 start_codon:yes stop_codon:yes gene_type:complete